MTIVKLVIVEVALLTRSDPETVRSLYKVVAPVTCRVEEAKRAPVAFAKKRLRPALF